MCPELLSALVAFWDVPPGLYLPAHVGCCGPELRCFLDISLVTVI